MLTDDLYVYRAMQAGINGYVLKSSAYEELAMALQAAKDNTVFISPAVSQVIIDEYMRSKPDSEVMDLYSRLTGREKEVLQLLAEENTRMEISKKMHVSVKTVDRHRENIKEKLGLNTDKELKDVARLLMHLEK